ncbi:hypothetical protein SK128_016663 [Halocaridina rubra]|uniref:Uncharacterized protein n=1 Tax=Halocaridina rubra TaxID=373956 RepID=A0AAN8X591_HALRR
MDGEDVFFICHDQMGEGPPQKFMLSHRSMATPMMYRYSMCKAVMAQMYQLLVAQVLDNKLEACKVHVTLLAIKTLPRILAFSLGSK